MESKYLQEEFEELMSLFLFGETKSEEEKRLNEIISLHPEFKKRYDNYVKLQTGLKQHKTGLEKVLIEPSKPFSKISLFPGKFKNQFLAIAAIISLIVSLSVVFQLGIFKKDEQLSIITTGICNLQTLRRDWIRTDQNSFCDVKIEDQVHFRIFPNSEVKILQLAETTQETKINGLSIFVQKGNLLLNETLTDNKKQTRIYLNGTEIQLTGTKVWIENSEERYKINVWEGSATVRSGVRYLLPFLLNKQMEKFVKHTLDEYPEQKIKYESIWNDISSEKLSNSSLETKSLFFQKDSVQNPLLTLNEKQTNPNEMFLLLEKMQKTIVETASHKKTIVLEKRDIQELETLASRFENPKLIELENEKIEPIILPVPKVEQKIKSKKEEPIRLGDKTIKLKDGSEWKGNLIQYEDRYIIEVEGKKKVILSKDVESISF
ncbi:FecR domain-containing protein [Leptospira noguchii]|uniref:FecR domain-containing protein n=1 Tax=Leptospira noguchii TaxID=28182 RepID=UPI000774DF3A|nr:FecR domain-containing protein [Leptospira noguchii]UOG60198.1 FecR family protein [Leptospira noguchii]